MSKQESPLIPLAAAALAEDPEASVVLLDSAIGDAELGARSLLAIDPAPALRISGAGLDESDGAGGWRRIADDDIWSHADAWLAVRWQGDPAESYVGWISWECGPIANPAVSQAAPVAEPTLWLGRVGDGWVERGGQLHRVTDGVERAARGHAEQAAPARVAASAPSVVSAPTEEWHRERIAAILAAIERGSISQACLTFPITLRDELSLWERYLEMRGRSPGDYAAFWQAGGAALACSSPERFLDFRDGEVVARPMKGTRPRSGGQAAARELAANPKDRAENIMIAELLRDELAAVCEPGSAHISELCQVEAYQTVWQMTSTVRGRLRPELGPMSLLAATFPPGSMSGRPKIEALALLNELEAGPRGLYAGSLFWLDGAQRWSFNVVIRSLIRDAEGALRWDVGGGIVAGSDARSEWLEAWLKAAALGLPQPR